MADFRLLSYQRIAYGVYLSPLAAIRSDGLATIRRRGNCRRQKQKSMMSASIRRAVANRPAPEEKREMPSCHEKGKGNPLFVLIVLAPRCDTEVARRGECIGRSTSMEEMLVTLEEIESTVSSA